jgi:hypothetical protein
VRLYFASLLIPLVGVFLFSYELDIVNLRDTDRVKVIAEHQGPDELIVAPDLFDHRNWVRGRLEQLGLGKSCPDVLLTGSSTISTYSADSLPGVPIFNAYVVGTSVEDLEALTSILRETQCWPRTIIVGADPWWIANPASENRRWTAWMNDYLNFNGQQRLEAYATRAGVVWSRFEERLNFATTRESLKTLMDTTHRSKNRLIKGGPGAVEDFCAHASPADYELRASDGHAINCPNFLPTPEQREQAAVAYIQVHASAMGEWREVDWSRVAALERVTREWSSHAGRVLLVALPFHPVTYRMLMQHPRIVPNLRALDSALGSFPGVTYLDLRDPSRVGCRAEEFLDAIHPGLACVGKVSARMAEYAR